LGSIPALILITFRMKKVLILVLIFSALAFIVEAQSNDTDTSSSVSTPDDSGNWKAAVIISSVLFGVLMAILVGWAFYDFFTNRDN